MLLFQQDEERWEDVPAGRGTGVDADMARCLVDGFAGRDRASRGAERAGKVGVGRQTTGRQGERGSGRASAGEAAGGGRNAPGGAVRDGPPGGRGRSAPGGTAAGMPGTVGAATIRPR